MKITLLWNEQTDYASEVREWLRDFKHDNHGVEIIEKDPESRDGGDFAQVYDILQYPAVVVTDNDGKLIRLWKGRPMPQIDEVSYWAAS